MITGTNIFDTWRKLENKVLAEGKLFQSQRNEVVELFNIHSCVRYPFIRGRHPYWFGQKLEDYIDQFFKANDQGFAYTYGDRIVNYDSTNQHRMVPCNQLEYIVDLLWHEPNTRRAVMSIYDPTIDMNVENIPCLNHIQYQIRDQRLTTTVVYRSHDIDAYYENVCGLAEVSKYIAEMVDVDLGRMHIYSNNLHKYVTEMPKYVLDNIRSEDR